MALEALAPFSVVDREEFDSWVAKNEDPFGYCIFTYAARWASLMEKEMQDGQELGAIARDASHLADEEGITGFMYGAAVGILAKCWKHGEQLRIWHNLDTQIGTEGERANQNGTVLNPAMLCVG